MSTETQADREIAAYRGALRTATSYIRTGGLDDLAAAKALLRECLSTFQEIGVEESLDLEARIRAVPGVEDTRDVEPRTTGGQGDG